MVYCSNCGTKLNDEAYFCFKCGTKTHAGKSAKVVYPSDEIRDAFYQIGLELEKAFTLVARETKAAFKKVRENTQATDQPSTQEMTTCSSCGKQNISGAVFCTNCGTKVEQ